MNALKSETLPLCTDQDVLRIRQTVRTWMIEQTFNMIEQTMMVTASSELARNVVVHGGGGSARLELLADSGRQGVRVTFEDKGPGIADIEQALADGYTTGVGLGMGLGGAKRLVNDFEIGSEVGKGTRVTITKWK
ncbi:MAG: ATP-binding protein [Methylococcaceae bacterium]